MRAVPILSGVLARVEGTRPALVIRSSKSVSLFPRYHRTLHTFRGPTARATLRRPRFDSPRRFASNLRYIPHDGPRNGRNNPSSNRNEYDGESICLKISDEVKHALKTNRPVVALESTIYTHGFPYPQNVDLALGLEEIVRQNGAVPATIGILNGLARVGLTTEEITLLASSAGKPETMKVSRRDLPYILGMVGCSGSPLHVYY